LKMNKIKLYLEEAYNELVNKVTWPAFSELQSSAIVVMVATAIISVIIYLMDTSFSSLMNLIYSMFY
jgi:preprotein translocase subunit SecE